MKEFSEDDIISFFHVDSCIKDDVSKRYLEDPNLNIYSNIDTFVYSTDRPILMPYSSVAYKAVLASLSDIFVKGLTPIVLGISLGLNIVKEHILKDLKLGFDYVFKRYGIKGCFKWDTNYTEDPFISVFSLSLGPDNIPQWNKASPGMYVYVDGYFGLTRLGLDLLLGKRSSTDFLDVYLDAVNEFLFPTPNLNLYPSIVKDLRVTASIDSSDGLARSLETISNQSRVKIVVDHIPVDDKITELVGNNIKADDVIEFVFYGGEEYRGIFVCDEIDEKTSKKYGLIKIGKVEKGIGVYLKSNGELMKLEGKGYIHTFR